MAENPYESDKLVSEYLLFHYGSADEILPPDAPAGMAEALDFAVRTPAHATTGGRALDLGCAVGRSAYEMSRTCDEVTGIDFSHAFVRAAAALAQGPLPYSRLDEAHRSTPLEAKLPQGVHAERVHFEQGDAMNLRPDLGAFDLVHAANLLCRLPEPERLLRRLPELVVSGGELILATPCTWLGEFTPPENWPEGPTLDWLQGHLGGEFELLSSTDEPFLIRETARKFQWTSSQLSHWRRR
ncbi:putative 4-mercaptohistidine N1-methyltransferase [Haloferula sp. A504]|uniref:putative 4-mercaptohistidine N1-methyltransferase n=1 Tax=Haloferula sp. A504 TaxID=3373601 RepID=UPI0031C6566A|nr:putative 4-mercaptohistidine N1-methyltransferase [Verrucomicrobiaceae bacterium E54]